MARIWAIRQALALYFDKLSSWGELEMTYASEAISVDSHGIGTDESGRTHTVNEFGRFVCARMPHTHAHAHDVTHNSNSRNAYVMQACCEHDEDVACALCVRCLCVACALPVRCLHVSRALRAHRARIPCALLVCEWTPRRFAKRLKLWMVMWNYHMCHLQSLQG